MNVKEFYVQAPDGYIAIERATCTSEAKIKASRRPGYESIDDLKAWEKGTNQNAENHH